MRTYGLFNICALIASGIVLAITYILVPEQSWTAGTTASVIVFSLAVAFLFFNPSIIKRRDKNNAAQFAAIGPISVLSGWLLLFSAGAVILSLAGYDRLAVALDVFTVGICLIGLLALRSAMNVVSHVAEKQTVASTHTRWQSDIQGFRAMRSEQKTVRLLDSLAEKLRYLASDIPGGTPFDSEIDSAIRNLGNQLAASPDSEIENHIRAIEAYLGKREVFLRSARSQS